MEQSLSLSRGRKQVSIQAERTVDGSAQPVEPMAQNTSGLAFARF